MTGCGLHFSLPVKTRPFQTHIANSSGGPTSAQEALLAEDNGAGLGGARPGPKRGRTRYMAPLSLGRDREGAHTP